MSSKIEQGFFDLQASVLGREDDDDCLRPPLPASSCVFCGPGGQEIRQDHGFAGSWRTADAADRVCFYACANSGSVVFDRQPALVPSPWQSRKLAEVRLFRRDLLSPQVQHCACSADAEISLSQLHPHLEPRKRRIVPMLLLRLISIWWM